MNSTRTDGRPIETMSADERAEMEQLLAGLTRSTAMAEGVLAEDQVLDFILALEAHRKEVGLTKTDLAKRLGIQVNQLTRWISAESSMKASTMFLLARMLGYRVRQVWEPIDAGMRQTTTIQTTVQEPAVVICGSPSEAVSPDFDEALCLAEAA